MSTVAELVAAEAAANEAHHIRVWSTATRIKLSEPEVTYDHEGITLCKMVGVPLMEVGMKFPASTGPVDFGFPHLDSAVRACADPTIPRPRIKLGHTDPRYNEIKCPNCEHEVKFDFNDGYLFDGDPNFGFVENMLLSDDNAVIIADLVDVPLWLASIAPVAFPSRSVEGWFDYEGINGRDYGFTVTALALLGVLFPGVMSLSDLPQMFGSEKPSFVEIVEVAA